MEIDLSDVTAMRAHWLEMYKNGRVKDLLKRIDEIEAAILDLFPLRGIQTVKQARDIENKAAKVMIEQLDDLLEELGDELEQLAIEDATFEANTIAAIIGAAVAIPSAVTIMRNLKQRPFVGLVYQDALNEFNEQSQLLIKNQIRAAFYEGKSIDQIVNSLAGSKGMGFRDGVFGSIRRKLETLVRTSVAATSAMARESVYMANKDKIIGVRWLAVLDGRTSATCRFLDGEIFPVGQGQGPPAHPNCRSTTIPVIDKRYAKYLDGTPTRPSESGEVSGKLTYGEWLKRQPASFQDEVLGKKKGKLFRSGGLTVDKFVNNGRELNLAELKAKFPDAWKAAKIEAKQ